jgi:hypothetical protein
MGSPKVIGPDRRIAAPLWAGSPPGGKSLSDQRDTSAHRSGAGTELSGPVIQKSTSASVGSRQPAAGRLRSAATGLRSAATGPGGKPGRSRRGVQSAWTRLRLGPASHGLDGAGTRSRARPESECGLPHVSRSRSRYTRRSHSETCGTLAPLVTAGSGCRTESAEPGEAPQQTGSPATGRSAGSRRGHPHSGEAPAAGRIRAGKERRTTRRETPPGRSGDSASEWIRSPCRRRRRGRRGRGSSPASPRSRPQW